MKKIILLNPASPANIQRDQFCSLTTKTDYLWAPVDLLLQSGTISAKHQVIVIDAIASKITEDECFKQIEYFNPDFVICLSSIISVENDLNFIERCKKKISCKAILIGDIFYSRSAVLIQDPRVDAILLQFPAKDLNKYLNGEKGILADVVYKDNDEVITGSYSKGEVKIGNTNHQIFPLQKYKVPLMRHHPFATVITTLSCPLTCSYCPVQGISFRKRNFEEIIIEFDSVKEMGIKELLIIDLMFNSDINMAKKICREMITRKYNFSWHCLMRPDKIDSELLALAKTAGCHTISFGVESTDHEILKANNRSFDFEAITECFKECKNQGIRALVIVLLGLPGETKKTAKKNNPICIPA